MTEKGKVDGCFVLTGILLLAVLMGIGGCNHYLRAVAQRNVWAREGIELTIWEVFLGAKPAEKLITIK